jgi:hypothetical protein
VSKIGNRNVLNKRGAGPRPAGRLARRIATRELASEQKLTAEIHEEYNAPGLSTLRFFSRWRPLQMIQADRKCIMMAAAFLLAPVCYAQAVAVAEVQGQVVDGSGSAVPGAQIKMTQTETDYVRNTTAGVDGSYSLPNLPVGPYTLEVIADGFKTHLQSGIILQVGSGVQVNVTLQVGSVTEHVRAAEFWKSPPEKAQGVGALIYRPRRPAIAVRRPRAPVRREAGLVWARLMADGKAKGRLRNPLDMIIAAVAEANNCLVVTENERDFAGLKIVNPLRAN